MARMILETEELDKELLDGFLARFEKNSFRSDRTDFEQMDSEVYIQYSFEQRTDLETWTGKIEVEVYENNFQARGDEFLMEKYFNSYELTEPEL